jgi:hypothetical protein
MLQAGRSRLRFPIRSLSFLIYLILLVSILPGVNSASDINGY